MAIILADSGFPLRSAELVHVPSRGRGLVSLPIREMLFAGAPSTEFENGVYHGRIILPPDYPFKPPSFIMLTPVRTTLTDSSCLVDDVLVVYKRCSTTISIIKRLTTDFVLHNTL